MSYTLAAPNKAVEPTAPMGALWQAGGVQGTAAHRQRSASALQTLKASCRLCMTQHSSHDGTTSF
jgi:hypothetical protein